MRFGAEVTVLVNGRAVARIVSLETPAWVAGEQVGHKRVILDTSILIASDADLSGLVCQISPVSYAELHFGVHGAPDDHARLSRQHRLAMIQSVYGRGIAFTDDTAHHYGLRCGRLRALGRSPRGRAMDVMIAATALTLGIALVTRNPDDVEASVSNCCSVDARAFNAPPVPVPSGCGLLDGPG